MSACVVPIGPNFQDPPATPDGSPNLFNFAPATFGSVVSVPATGITFSASVTDPDVGDALYYRWVLDYPPFGAATRIGNQNTIAPRVDRQPINQSLSQPVDCAFVNPVAAPADGKHQLELIVADRAWSTDTADLSADKLLDTLDDPAGLIARASWTVVISCPVQ